MGHDSGPKSRSRALLIGLNYKHVLEERVLTGCINDVRNMADFLEREVGMNKKDITVVTDEFPEDVGRATYEELIFTLMKLAAASWHEDLDFVVIHFSGHGRQTPDLEGDEEDGLDEGIVPVDYKVTGVLRDDRLLSLIKVFNPKTRVLCVFDCCHSGTILDLPFVWGGDGVKRKCGDDLVPAHVICLSAARDQDIAGEIHGGGNKERGAFTTYLLEELKEDITVRILELQRRINERLQKAGYDQVHVMSASRDIPTSLNLLEFLM